MIALGDRDATAAAIREIARSAYHSWKADLERLLHGAQVPCSFTSLGTPGRVNSVYPNGDNMRDIPDYTEFVPGWVWRYYLQRGDRAHAAVGLRDDEADLGLHPELRGDGRQRRQGSSATCSAGPAPTSTASSTGRRRCATATRSPTTRRADDPQRRGGRTPSARPRRRRAALGQAADAAQYGGWADTLARGDERQAHAVRRALHRRPVVGDAGNPQIDNTAQQAQSVPDHVRDRPGGEHAGAGRRPRWPRACTRGR